MTRATQKLKLIFWKNVKIRRRHLILSIAEIVLPVGCVLLLVSALSSLKELGLNEKYIADPKYHEVIQLNKNYVKLYYTPNNSIINQLMDRVREKTPCLSFDGATTEEEMMNYITTNKKLSTSAKSVGIVFEDFPDERLPIRLKYQLRTEMMPIYDKPFMSVDDFSDQFNLLTGFKDQYFSSSFIDVQHSLDLSYIEMLAGLNMPQVDVTMQELPYPPHQQKDVTVNLLVLMPMMLVLSLLIIFQSIVKRIVEEKNTGIKELMKMMGLQSWMLWLSWLMYSLLTNVICVVLIVLLLSHGLCFSTLIQFTHWSVVFVIITLFFLSTIFFAFMWSTFFSKPILAVSIGILFWVISYVFSQIIQKSSQLAFLKFSVWFFPTIVLDNGFFTIFMLEREKKYTSWYNIWDQPDVYDQKMVPLAVVMLVFVGQCLLYSLILWYIDNVFPGRFGVAKPWYFLLQVSYWRKNPKVTYNEIHFSPLPEQPGVETISRLQPGLQIRDLHKSYGNIKAVDGLNIDIYKNQITVLLGHNGAGKTTTMHMITGMISSTKGIILVEGHDTRIDMDRIRDSLGLCPQTNMHFTDLTVKEHLMFFAMLKGMDRNIAEQEAMSFIQKLNLLGKENDLAMNLSGGMKRKLSLMMAIIGSPQLLVLDEPTSGLDPEGRREIWDLLLSMRGAKTLIITTHDMEEADILGDHIAIMHRGTLQCYGTTLYLKKYYGTGYMLTCLLAKDSSLESISNFIKQYVPAAQAKNKSAAVVNFSLPTTETSVLTNLFTDLERQKDNLCISAFSVFLTTLDEVFLKVGDIADQVDRGDSRKQISDSSTNLLSSTSTFSEDHKIPSPVSLACQQCKALFIKQFHYVRHRWLIFLILMLIPALLTLLLTFLGSKLTTQTEAVINYNLNLSSYFSTKTFYSNVSETSGLAAYYNTVVMDQKSDAVNVDSVSDASIKYGLLNERWYIRRLVVSSELNYTENKMKLNALFGVSALNGPPISLNLLTNSLVKYVTNNESYGIDIRTHTLPQKEVTSNSNGVVRLMFEYLLILSMLIVVCMLAIMPLEERVSNVKHLQIMTGVWSFTYWAVNFIFDTIFYLMTVTWIVLVLVSMDANGQYGNLHTIGWFWVLMIFFGLAIFPFVYLFTYRPTPGSLMSNMLLIQVFGGNLAHVLIQNTSFMKTFEPLFYMLPSYAVIVAVQKFLSKSDSIYLWEHLEKNTKVQICKLVGLNMLKDQNSSVGQCCDVKSEACQIFMSYFSGEESMKKPCLYLLLQFLLYSLILGLIESKFIHFASEKCARHMRRMLKYEDRYTKTLLDEDVIEEKELVEKQIKQKNITDVMVGHRLEKWYGKVHAVRGVSFGVRTGECFGLLGINGAGKTSTFKMLTADIVPTSGEGYSLGTSIDSNKSKYLQNIGYCPQFDALNFRLTSSEMLNLFGRLRGVPEKMLKGEVRTWLDKCDIMRFEHVQCSEYSGGTKRKLCTAMALIGNPPVVMLDEPSSGVDPHSRRLLWDNYIEVRKSGRSVILTSHSMEECEALCDRLAIMVDGQFKCVGHIAVLKNKFGQGFTLMIKLSAKLPTAVPTLKNEIEKNLECTLKDEHMTMLLYHITKKNVTVGSIFGIMERLKNKYSDLLEDFTVCDTSLEEVFLSFAKEKKINDEKVRQQRAKVAVHSRLFWNTLQKVHNH